MITNSVTRGALLFGLIAIPLSIIYHCAWKDKRPFNNRTTAQEAIGSRSLRGQTIIVTGCNTGIGKETVKVLLGRGAHVVMACRNEGKAWQAAKDILHATSNQSNLNDRLDVMELNLGSLDSVKQFVKRFSSQYDALNCLILNAGTVGLYNEWSSTSDGIETVFGVNHLGHFYLSLLLTPYLVQTATRKKCISRVVCVASAAHHWIPSNFTAWLRDERHIQNPTEYGYVNYGFSKACNILFAREYNDRYSSSGVYPGTIATELGKHRPKVFPFMKNLLGKAGFLKSWSQGAATTLRTVGLSDQEFSACGGGYFADCNIANDLHAALFPKNQAHAAMPQSLLWKLSVDMLAAKNHCISFTS